MATLLISKADFAGHVDIASNIDEVKKINPQILHAQIFDLRGLMGDKLYYDFINNINTSLEDPQVFTAPYLALFEGEQYDNGGITFSYDGLKAVIVYFAAARLIKDLDMHITPNGIMHKRNEFSDAVELKEKIFRANQYENQAIAYWNMAKTYLDAKSGLFDYWNIDCDRASKSGYRPKMFAIGHSNHPLMEKEDNCNNTNGSSNNAITWQ